MSSYIHFRQDVAKVLDAVDMKSEGMVTLISEEVEKALQEGRRVEKEQLADYRRIYRQGYRNALTAVAQAFGIVPRVWTVSQENGRFPKIREFRLPIWEV